VCARDSCWRLRSSYLASGLEAHRR
jgi:hypothetical protein